MQKHYRPYRWSFSNPSQLFLWRESHNINGNEFSSETGVNRSVLCQIERRRIVASESVKSAILNYCGVEAHEFFDVDTGLAV